jgi:glycosyltransferase involved in cell wall biosynthesis
MKIAINCWVLRNKQTDGIGYFTINTVSAIIKSHPDVHFLILCDKNFNEDYFDFDNVTLYHLFPSLRHPVLYFFYMEFVLPFFLKRKRPDVYVSTDGFLSLTSKTIQIPIIYDINFEHKPQDLKIQNRLYFRFFFKRFARKANRIATISEYSKQDIAQFYKIDPGKIDNVSCGINSNFFVRSQEEIKSTKNKWSAGKSYFFFVGSMHPRKNIGRLIEAFNLFKDATKSDLKLLLAGSILWSKSEIDDAYHNSPYRQDIVFSGRLNDADLQKVLGAAFALAFVPLFEGFGLPIVEAMKSGVPVISSNVTSMPEVAGPAAIYVDPLRIDSISKAMIAIYEDAHLRSSLIEKGEQRQKLFSWEKTASLLWQCIQKSLAQDQAGSPAQ